MKTSRPAMRPPQAIGMMLAVRIANGTVQLPVASCSTPNSGGPGVRTDPHAWYGRQYDGLGDAGFLTTEHFMDKDCISEGVSRETA